MPPSAEKIGTLAAALAKAQAGSPIRRSRSPPPCGGL